MEGGSKDQLKVLVVVWWTPDLLYNRQSPRPTRQGWTQIWPEVEPEGLDGVTGRQLLH